MNSSNADSLEYQVLSSIRERSNWSKYSYLLNEGLFESYQTKLIYKTINDFHASHESDNITTNSLKALLYSSIKPTEKEKFRLCVARIRKNRLTDGQVIDTVVHRFAKRQLIKQMVLEGLNALEQGEDTDLERVRQRIDEAIGIDSKDVSESYDYFHDPLKRVTLEKDEGRIATLIHPEIDEAIEGGLGKGEIALFIAPTGVGKTLHLVNIGYGALMQGKKVVHCTLEIAPRKVAKRYDVRSSGHGMEILREDPGLISKSLHKLLRKGGGLQIKDYTSRTCSVLDIKCYLEHLRTNGFHFDVLIVDHMDLMYTPKQYNEKRFELSAVIEGLRRLGNYFRIPVWTASQAGRQAGIAGRTTLWDVAEDIGKANSCDLAITISQNEGEKDDGEAILKIAKNRIGKGNPKVVVSVDLDTQTVTSYKKSNEGDLRRELRG